MQLTSSYAWKIVQQHADSFNFKNLIDLKEKLPIGTANDSFIVTACGIQLDYSKQRVNNQTLSLLIALAEARDLRSNIQALFRGDIVNPSENKPALHSALRANSEHAIWVNGQNVMPEVEQTRRVIQKISEQIRTGQWFGKTGKRITDVVNIGIGGSDLGPRLCIKGLSNFKCTNIKIHFISDVDPAGFLDVVNHLNPETTLFIVASKSFMTQETLYNAKKAIAWLGGNQFIAQHLIAVTANIEAAQQLGITTILPIWDWVGGRYSLCSAINLITAIGIGFENFNQLLKGASDMDQHFQGSDFSNNLPVLLALLGIWNNNFLHINNLLFLVYSTQLELFVPYVQQLDMESNGKSIDIHGRDVNYSTGPIVWGGLGNQAQHSYYQLLSQGTHKITTDFISLKDNDNEIINELCNLKMHLLANGNHIKNDNYNNFIHGNMPLNHIYLESCSPYVIGALTALYEHKIFVQSVIWGINPFDQPGVADTKKKVLEAGNASS